MKQPIHPIIGLLTAAAAASVQSKHLSVLISEYRRNIAIAC